MLIYISRERCDIIHNQRGEFKVDQQQIMDILTKILESQDELRGNQEAINKKLEKIELLFENDKKVNALNDIHEDQKELSEIVIAVRKKSKHLN